MSQPPKKRSIFRHASEFETARLAARSKVATPLVAAYNERRLARNAAGQAILAEIQHLKQRMVEIADEIETAEEEEDLDRAELLLDDLEAVEGQISKAEDDLDELRKQEGAEQEAEAQALRRAIESEASREAESIAPRRVAVMPTKIRRDFPLALVEAAANEPSAGGKRLAQRSDFDKLLGYVRGEDVEYREFAWLLLIAEVWRPLLAICRRVVRGTNADPEELLTETLGAAYRKIAQYRGSTDTDSLKHFLGWLRQIADNEHKQNLRSAKEVLERAPQRGEDDSEAPPSLVESATADSGSILGLSPEAAAEAAAFEESIIAGLRAVSRTLRDGKTKTEMFRQHYIDGIPQGAIAEAAGIGRTTVIKYLQQVMQALGKAYPELVEEGDRLLKSQERVAAKSAAFAEQRAASRDERAGLREGTTVGSIAYDKQMSPVGRLMFVRPKRVPNSSRRALRSRRRNPANALPAFLADFIDTLRGRF